MKIVFATNNAHKLSEIRDILGTSFEVVSLADIGCTEDIPEDGQTLQDNALIKAQYVHDKYHVDCFADDTGLEVEALDGAPGVYSARYAGGAGHDSQANMNKLLGELGNNDNRKARFRTVIALILQGKTTLFEGICKGEIIREKRGGEGFGYDPIFQPSGYEQTFAELGTDIKNQISHRARATAKLAAFLRSIPSLCLFLFFIFSLLCSPAEAQIGTWKNFLAYSDIQQIEAAGQELFVMASNGLYQYNKQDQSIYTYDKVNGLSDVTISHIRWCQQAKRLVVVYDNANIDLVETNNTVTNISDIYSKSITGGKNIYNVTIRNQYAYLATDYGVSKVDVKKAEISESYMLGFAVNAVSFDDTNIYVQSPTKGIWTCPLTKNLIDPNNWTQTASAPSFDQDLTAYNENIALVKTLQPGGPKTNLFGWLRYYKEKLWTAVGGYNMESPIQVYDNHQWQIYQYEGVSDITGVSYQGAFCFDIDPLSSDDHVFAGSRNGLYEFRNGKFVAFYNSNNSPIESYDGNNLEYELVTGVKYDYNGNLWILNSQTATTSLVKFTNGEFTKFNEPVLMKLNYSTIKNYSNGELGKMMIDSNGKMWFTNNNWFLPALYQYDMQTDNITAYETFTNQDGSNVVLTYGVRCVTEDLSKNIWIGTDNGPLMLERSQIDNQGTTFTQIKVPRNDGTDLADYLLAGLDIKCITVDGAGRKWIGTNGNGVYLISTDNMEQLQHFTSENSPLLSDIVMSIAINPNSGEVFFGTDKGLCSFISDATEASTEMTKDNVWAYPNPVTPDYTGPITITGLTMDADVKILAANGALIHQGRSNGGTYTWDGCDREGRRVASGVYMVATATSSGEKGTVCKIAIVR